MRTRSVISVICTLVVAGAAASEQGHAGMKTAGAWRAAAASVFASDSSLACGLGVAESSLAWASRSGRLFWQTSERATRSASVACAPGSIVSHGATLFVACNDSDAGIAVVAVDTRDGGARNAVTGRPSPSGLAVSDAGIWLSFEEAGQVLLFRPNPVTIAGGQNNPSDLALVGSTAFWRNEGKGNLERPTEWRGAALMRAISSRGRGFSIEQVAPLPFAQSLASSGRLLAWGQSGALMILDPSNGAARYIKIGDGNASLYPIAISEKYAIGYVRDDGRSLIVVRLVDDGSKGSIYEIATRVPICDVIIVGEEVFWSEPDSGQVWSFPLLRLDEALRLL